MSNQPFVVDINSDVGERPGALDDGSEEDLIRHISSANIACGGHAGDLRSMERTVTLAARYGAGVGAHPSYPDKANFGRLELPIARDKLVKSIFEQVQTLAEVCVKLNLPLVHVKPHGALYNVAVKDASIASLIAEGVERVSKDLILVGLANSQMLTVWEDAGFRVAGEAFIDRNYEADGTLRSRKFADALIPDPSYAAARAVQIVRDGIIRSIDGSKIRVRAKTLCVHSDTPGAQEILKAVREAFRESRIEIRGL